MSEYSPRIQKIIELIVSGKDVWDVCCDHGYIGIGASKSGKAKNVYFVDQVEHIIEKLKSELHDRAFAQSEKKHFFLTKEAQLIDVPVTGNLVISGVGSHKILSIIKHLWGNSILYADRVILVPQRDPEVLKSGIIEIEEFLNTYQLTGKIDIDESGRIKSIFVYDRI